MTLNSLPFLVRARLAVETRGPPSQSLMAAAIANNDGAGDDDGHQAAANSKARLKKRYSGLGL